MEWYWWLVIITGTMVLVIKLYRMISNGRAVHWKKLRHDNVQYLVIAVGYFPKEKRGNAIVRQTDNLADPIHIFFNPEWDGHLNPNDIFFIDYGPARYLPHIEVLGQKSAPSQAP